MTKDEAREILDRFNAWRKGWGDDFPYEAKQITQAIDCAIQALGEPDTIKPYHEHGNSVASDRTEPGESGQSAEDNVKWNEYEYAKQLAMLIHARCYPELPQWEPLPDLMGLLTQIDNMVCGLERKVEAGQSAEEWDKAEGVLGRCTCAEIYTSRRMTDPNCAWCEYHVDLIQAMRLHASQVCADKDREIEKIRAELVVPMAKSLKEAEEEYVQLQNEMTESKKEILEKDQEIEMLFGLIESRADQFDKIKSELSKANESLTVMVRRNAELDTKLSESKQRIKELEEQIRKLADIDAPF